MAGEIRRMDICSTAIPMRTFEHAASSRSMAEAVLVKLEFDDGQIGWGECLPRPYVTGETIPTVIDDLQHVIWPACKDIQFDEPGATDAIPLADSSGRCINSAACAFAMAAGFYQENESATSPITARVSGVLGNSDPAKTSRKLRLMRWIGLRDFKLKLGFGADIDRANLEAVHAKLGKAIASGKCTLRVDVNGGWTADETPQRIADLKIFGVCVVEQPVYCTAAELVDLARKCELPLIADESLITSADADIISAEADRIWWNIRLSKNGGPNRAAALAQRAASIGAKFVIGCMVGESSILSAAQRKLLMKMAKISRIARPEFVEGNYGKFLLADDLTKRSLRFGYGGKLRPIKSGSPQVSPAKLARYGKLIARVEA